MSKNENYENKLLKCLMSDIKVFNKMIKVIQPKVLFNNTYNRFIYTLLKEYKEKYDGLPTHDVILDIIEGYNSNSNIYRSIKDQYQYNIHELVLNESEKKYIVDSILERHRRNMIDGLSEKLSRFSDEQLMEYFHKLEELTNTEKSYEVTHLWDEMEEKERIPLQTGLELIDEFGVSRGELGMLVAGTGIGKSVFLTFLANQFMLSGHNVLHIVFEGSKSSYIQSHLRKLNNPNIESLKQNTNNLMVIQLPSNLTTSVDIEGIIKDLIDDGFVPDVMVIDYIDCIVGDNPKKENWQNDINVINEIEAFAQKYNMAIWTASQTNRTGLNKPIEISNIQGSISKAQKATLVIALTRDEYQQQHNQATLQILKNRFGILKSSVNCLWNPKEMIIEAPITPPIIL